VKRRAKVSAKKKIFRERERAMRAGGRCEKGVGDWFQEVSDNLGAGKILRRKQEKWLRIAGVDNKGASLKKLMEFLK
jgi:hypothetical protein